MPSLSSLCVAAVAAAAVLALPLAAAAEAAPADAPTSAAASKVDHVVLLVMENRPYDHFFGWTDLPGADGLNGTECNYKNVSDPSQGQGCVQKGKAKYVCQVGGRHHRRARAPYEYYCTVVAIDHKLTAAPFHSCAHGTGRGVDELHGL